MSSPARDRLAMALPSRARRGAIGGGWGVHTPAEPRAGEGGPNASAVPGTSPASRMLSRSNISRFGDAPPMVGNGQGCGASAAAGGSGSNGGSWNKENMSYVTKSKSNSRLLLLFYN